NADGDSLSQDLATWMMKIRVTKNIVSEEPEDTGIVIEGITHQSVCMTYLIQTDSSELEDVGRRQRCHSRVYIEENTVGIYIIKLHACDPEDMLVPEGIGIVLEGLLQDLDNVALATAMLFGLMYALNLNFPSELKYIFEVLQKVVMELEGKPSHYHSNLL
ncbi:hypothetical protein QTP70_029094, partial [Hemibagrus guttatus]